MSCVTAHKSYHADGSLYIECFKKGYYNHGEYKRWSLNGQLQEHSFYKEGVHHGEFKWWYENGQMESHSFYKDGYWDGEFRSWFADGSPRSHTFWNRTMSLTGDVIAIVNDINNITPEEKVFIKLQLGIPFLTDTF